MIEKPILFAPQSVRAILEGRKTMTRRVLKPQPVWNDGGVIFNAAGGQEDYVEPHWAEEPAIKWPVGTRLWVREALLNGGRGLQYVADGAPVVRPQHAWNWTFNKETVPSMYMPRWASRITLEVTGVKVERLQDICEEDAITEGVTYHPPTKDDYDWYESFCEEHGDDPHVPMDGVWKVAGVDGWGPTPQFAFRLLWQSIHGPAAWDANPWVAAYTFERVKS